MSDPELSHALSDAEAIYWHRWCMDLRDQILLARARGLDVIADKRLDYRVVNLGDGPVGRMSGLTIYTVVC